MHNQSTFNLYKSSFCKLVGLTLILGFLLRIILLFNSQTIINYSALEWVEIYVLGTLNDLCFAIISYVFLWLFLIFFSNKKYNRPWSIIIPVVLFVLFIILQFFNTPLREFNKGLTQVICFILLWRLISFAIREHVPFVRVRWRQYSYYAVIFIYVTCIVLNAIAEYFFWNEFGVRYNFIAVDYLVYTSEVIGNIFESYPMVPIISGLLIVSFGITYLLLRHTGRSEFEKFTTSRNNAICSVLYLFVVAASAGLLNLTALAQHNDNRYANELQANGCVKFCQAFLSNELNYNDFYPTLSWKDAFMQIHKQYHSGIKNEQFIHSSQPELHKNIVLITIESMSGEYLKRFGNTENITPNLDKVMNEGLCFDNFYAVGNRTVRGLEAVTLCSPPSPGESIIKQKNNGGLFSTGKILKDKGYDVQFLYGGDSYFDNMKEFFEDNHYKVIDQKNFKQNEITFKTVWGLCDEDLFNKAIKVFNEDDAHGKPFFGHIMTVSNHRPYMYPDGHIDIPSSKKCREGGVKYTDYAIGKFLEKASHEPWFKNTVFVITADHCASSSGSTDVPLDQYHIPAVIYAPGFVKPQQNRTLISQIDLMPTVFGLLHFNYTSRFYGQDVLSKNYHPRAFAATYQDLGYWENSSLIVMSPVRRNVQYQILKHPFTEVTGNESKYVDKDLLKRAIGNYQTARYIIGRYGPKENH